MRMTVAYASEGKGGRAIPVNNAGVWTLIHTVPGVTKEFDEVTMYIGDNNPGTAMNVDISVGVAEGEGEFRAVTGNGLDTALLGHRMKPGESIWVRPASANRLRVLVQINRGKTR